MWAPCKASAVQISPHRDRNERGLVSHRQEAVNSPGFWASIISGDCSWTYWGAQIVSATGKATPPLGQRGAASLSPCLSACHVWIGVPKVQSPHRGQDCRLLRVGCLPPFIYLFILYLRGFVNTCKVGISTLQPSTTPFPSKGLGVKQRTPWESRVWINLLWWD